MFLQHLKEIQSVGPYTIVGESWSGAVAIELVSLLEKNDKVKLILLEGIPNDMRNKLLSMGSFGSQEFLYNLQELCFENKQVRSQITISIKNLFERYIFLCFM